MNNLFYLRLLGGTIIVPVLISTKFDKKAIMEITPISGDYTIKSEFKETITENDVKDIVYWIWETAKKGIQFIDMNNCPKVIILAKGMK